VPLLLQTEHCDALQNFVDRVIEDQGQPLRWEKKEHKYQKKQH
jgi:hypothetical protein